MAQTLILIYAPNQYTSYYIDEPQKFNYSFQTFRYFWVWEDVSIRIVEHFFGHSPAPAFKLNNVSSHAQFSKLNVVRCLNLFGFGMLVVVLIDTPDRFGGSSRVILCNYPNNLLSFDVL